MESQLCNVKSTRGRKKKRRREGKRKHLLAMQCRVSQAEREVVRLAAWRRHRGRGKYSPFLFSLPYYCMSVNATDYEMEVRERRVAQFFVVFSNFTANFTPNYFTPGLFLSRKTRQNSNEGFHSFAQFHCCDFTSLITAVFLNNSSIINYWILSSKKRVL